MNWYSQGFWLSIAAILVLGFFVSIALISREIRQRKQRLSQLGQRIVTPCGPVQFVEIGTGNPVLVIHGGMGGADQTADLMTLFPEGAGRFLCISRPGYLGTPQSSGVTVEAQARLIAALLDELQITCLPVIGVSLGAAYALRFAQLFPERCVTLVLVGGAFQQLTDSLRKNQQKLYRFRTLRRPDFVGWCIQRFGLRGFCRWKGVSPSLWREVARDPRRRRVLQALIAPLATISLRLDGLENDLERQGEIDAMTLAGIDQPVLLIHGKTDGFAPFSEAERIASTLPNASLHAAPDGGHVCLVTHCAEFVPVVAEFLSQHAAGGRAS